MPVSWFLFVGFSSINNFGLLVFERHPVNNRFSPVNEFELKFSFCFRDRCVKRAERDSSTDVWTCCAKPISSRRQASAVLSKFYTKQNIKFSNEINCLHLHRPAGLTLADVGAVGYVESSTYGMYPSLTPASDLFEEKIPSKSIVYHAYISIVVDKQYAEHDVRHVYYLMV